MSWYEQAGREGDIVLSSRARLARNYAQYPFPSHMKREEEEKIINLASGAMEGYTKIELSDATPVSAGALMERHLISPEMLNGDARRGVLLSPDERVSIMVCEEDHLRIQALCAGFDPKSVLEQVMEADEKLEQVSPYAFSETLGYLTHCPTNLGTGLRAGVMLHLPIMTESGAIRALMDTTAKLGFAVRGLYGEGSAAQGALYQISNQVTLGVTEEEIIYRLEQVVGGILSQERGLRARYQEGYKDRIEDRVYRSAGTLAAARLLPLSEAMVRLSDLRLGVSLGILSGVSMEEMNRILFEMQPNCLISRIGASMKYIYLDKIRADLVRPVAKKVMG